MRPFGRWIVTSTLTLLTLGSAALVTPGPAGAAAPATPARYTVTDLGSLSGDLSAATAINNNGEVVGYSLATAQDTHGFRWSGGAMTDLGVEPGGHFSQANAVNDAGQIAGTASRPGGSYVYPVSWSAAGAVRYLGGTIDNQLGYGNGIDASGRVVGGQRGVSSEGAPYAIRYDLAGNPTILGNPPESLGVAQGTNARGQVVGAPAYIWDDGTLTYLPVLDPAFPQSAMATAINTGGTAVGFAAPSVQSSSSTQDAVWWRHGEIADLGTLDGDAANRPNAINASEQIVGTSAPSCLDCGQNRAWFWQAGLPSLTPLDTLIPAGSGWTLEQANGINDRGQIVGRGTHDGHTRAYLLTPTLDPGTWYRVLSVSSGKCLDGRDLGTVNGTPLQQWDCTSPAADNQSFQFQPTGDGYYKVLYRHAPALAWDISGGSSATGNGAKADLWDYAGGTNQQWKPTPHTDGSYTFTARHSGKCLDVTDLSTHDGAPLQQWTCTDNSNQAFTLQPQP